MKNRAKREIVQLAVFILLLCNSCLAQSPAIQSSIINFGSNSCGNTSAVTFSAIGDPSGSPYLISNCDISPPFGDVFSKYIAYNPKDNKIYVNDISHGDSRIYIYDMGLPDNYTCPATMPTTPTYQYAYVPNNFEFDVNGDIWCIRNLSGNTATIERIDEATGTVLASKTIDFPAGNAPNTLGSGDIVITPNGRMFITMGDSPSKFYEISNYSTSSPGDAIANFIQNMPSPCYGIVYINGTIELTGTDFGGSCYKYVFDIPSQTMGTKKTFQLGMTPVDNTSISPATGIAKSLFGVTVIDSTTANIIYQVDAKNLGNVILKNFNILEDLTRVFGAGNVSNVSLSFVPGANPSNLVLNPSFDGVTDIKIFSDNQNLSNLINGNVSVYVMLRAKNLMTDTIYYNTAKAVGEIGSGTLKIAVIDSSNNGIQSYIDPNGDGDAGDIGENVPTPFYFGGVLPVKFTDINAKRVNSNLNNIGWSIAAGQPPLTKFEVEYSTDNINWQVAGTVSADKNKSSYSFNHDASDNANYFYRIRTLTSDGKNYSISKVVTVALKEDKKNTVIVMPNPADAVVKVYCPSENFTGGRTLSIIEASGRKIAVHSFTSKYININSTFFPDGYYIIQVMDKGVSINTPLIIKH